jgi:hypothetical protein
MSDEPLSQDLREQAALDEGRVVAPDAPELPDSSAGGSVVGDVAGTTGPTPLTGAQIIDATDDNPDTVT